MSWSLNQAHDVASWRDLDLTENSQKFGLSGRC